MTTTDEDSKELVRLADEAYLALTDRGLTGPLDLEQVSDRVFFVLEELCQLALWGREEEVIQAFRTMSPGAAALIASQAICELARDDSGTALGPLIGTDPVEFRERGSQHDK